LNFLDNGDGVAFFFFKAQVHEVSGFPRADQDQQVVSVDLNDFGGSIMAIINGRNPTLHPRFMRV
jgi:hypothetical protein